MTESAFEQFLTDNGILVGVVVDIPRSSIFTCGNLELLESDSILRYYFSDPAKLNEYLMGRILPTMLQLGKVAGVVAKPDENSIVGLLYHDDRPVLERYQYSFELDKRLRDLWQPKLHRGKS